MATTLTQARSRVRTWLEDTSGTPLWTDAEVDEGLHVALDGYSALAPDELATTLAAADGDTQLALPAGSGVVVRVTDPNGYVIPPRGVPARSVAAEELAWERWGDALVFSRQLAAGDYAVRSYGPRAMPALAGDPYPVPDADVSLCVAAAVVWLITERMGQEWKRGPLPARYTTLRDAARQDYTDRLRAWRRRLRVHPLDAA